MITSTISHTKSRLSELLVRVQAGETLVIVDRKTPVATIERINKTTGNPNLRMPLDAWNPEEILNLPVFPGEGDTGSLVTAVIEERTTGQ